MRFGHGSRRAILQTTVVLAALLATPLLVAAPPEGKGNDKDDGSTSDPPPVTYMVTWIDDFGLNALNENGDLVGQIPSLAGIRSYPSTYGLIYNGDRYVLDEFFIGTSATPRILFDLSERLSDGSLYLCGSCDTVDGVRGWRMKVSPSTNGLERVAFSILHPAEGDTISALKNININGESVGYSYNNEEGSPAYAALYQSDVGTTEISPSGSPVSFITDSGLVFSQLVDADGISYISSWSLGGAIEPIVLASDVGAYHVHLLAVNEAGEFLFDATERWEKPNGRTAQNTVTYFYDVTYNYLTDRYADPAPYYEDLNVYGDLLSQYYASGKGNKPGRYVNEVYFADLAITEELDNMIDEANLQEDVDRWFDSLPLVGRMTDSGVISGSDVSNTTSSSFVLVPVAP